MMAWHTSLTASDWVLWGYPPTKPHGRVLGPRCEVAQNDGNLQARIQGLPVPGSLFGDPGTNSLYQIIVHLWGHSEEVLEGPLVLSAELHQQLVIHAKLTTPADPWSHPHCSRYLRSSSSSSPPSGLDLVKCQLGHIVLVLEDGYLIIL